MLKYVQTSSSSAHLKVRFVQLFNASHMAPWDVPHVAHDMILRFMGFNFSAALEGSARIPSSVGSESKPVFIETSKPTPSSVPGAGKSPEQDKAMWEGEFLRLFACTCKSNTGMNVAYYNAGSSALVLILIMVAVGIVLWCRVRRRRMQPSTAKIEEESIPLTRTFGDSPDEDSYRQRKGKQREIPENQEPSQTIFGVGEIDDDEYGNDAQNASVQ